ncbi:MAG: hypothetical protein K9N55_06575 [Phycisphaerae bacterium]|nr:hypothetical protein [Phycisphaerae bacterium]
MSGQSLSHLAQLYLVCFGTREAAGYHVGNGVSLLFGQPRNNLGFLLA